MQRRKFLGSLAAGVSGTALFTESRAPLHGQVSGGLDDTLPPGTLGEPIPIGLNVQIPFARNGRQLARTRDGRWFIVYACHPSRLPDGSYRPTTDIWIRSSKTATPQSLADFEPEVLLIRDAKGGYGGPPPDPQIGGFVIEGGGAHPGTMPSIVIDPKDVLHLIWQRQDQPEIWYAQCDLSSGSGNSPLSDIQRWRRSNGSSRGAECIAWDRALLGDVVLDRNGRLCVLYQDDAGIVLAKPEKGDWSRTYLTKGQNARWPSIAADRSGALHAAFVAAQGVSGGLLYYTRSDDDGARWTGASANDGTPDLIGGYCREQPTIAVSGSQVLVVHAQGVNVINFTHFDGQRWSGNTVLPKSYNHGSPTLTVDCHDVMWLQMAHKQLDWTQTCRWLGDRWSDVQEGRHLKNFAHAVSGERQTHANGLGMLLADSSHGLFFDTIAVPVPVAAAGHTVMFLDLWETAALHGVSQVVEPLQKDERNPLMRGGKEGEWDWGQLDFQGTILKDNGRYRMWYTGLPKTPLTETEATLNSACGYAESTDGVRWTKPDLGLYAWNGSKHNNICLPFGYHFNVLKMPEDVEPNPARRYRMVTTARNILLAFSPDGIHWTLSKENPLWRSREDARCLYCGLDNVTYIYDPLDANPRRRFKAYPQANPGAKMRVSALMVSADGIHFREYPNNPILDADLGVEPQNHLIELCWQRHGLFIGLYGCLLEDVRVDARLAVSRDGVHWVRVKDEIVMLPPGPKGSWEGSMVYPSNYPVIDGEDVWIYYAGLQGDFSDGEGHSCVGRARTRLDGFAKMELDAGHRTGSLTTVPFEIPEGSIPRLVINADRLAQGKRWIKVEVLDAATGAVLAGHGAEDCTALEADGIALPVTWRGRASFAEGRVRRVRFRFLLSGTEGSPRLCAFGFV